MSYMIHCANKAFLAGMADGEEELKHIDDSKMRGLQAGFGENEAGLWRRAYEYAYYEVHARGDAVRDIVGAYVDGFYAKSIMEEW